MPGSLETLPPAEPNNDDIQNNSDFIKWEEELETPFGTDFMLEADTSNLPEMGKGSSSWRTGTTKTGPHSDDETEVFISDD